MLYDLHLHSFYSDGERGFNGILEHALTLGMRGLAITDHNGVCPEVKHLVARAKKYNIEILEGVEVSSQISLGRGSTLSLHILGYSLDFNTGKLNDGLKETVSGYEKRARTIVKKCQNLGIRMNHNKLRSSSRGLYVSRNTIAKEITKQQKINFDQALKIAFMEEKEDWFMTSHQAISLIKESGGVPVLAHPGKLIPKLLERSSAPMLEILIKEGLRGIEVFYPTHTRSETRSLLKLANKYGLVVTGGTDYHGPHRPPYTEIGDTGIGLKEFKCLKMAAEVIYKSSQPYWSRTLQYSPSF